MTYLLILAVYSVSMIVLGVIASRRVRESGDFFVAGRTLSAGLIFSTLLAANIGAGSTVGATGLGYRDGLSAFWWVASAGVGSLILAFTVGPKIWAIAKENDLYTIGDYLEYRYDRRVRGLVALFLWFGTLAILAGQLIAIGWVLNVIAGISKPLGCFIGAAVTTVYFALGGLQGTARVNVLQLIIKLFGFCLAIAYLLKAPIGAELAQGLAGKSMPQNLGRMAQAEFFSIAGIGPEGILRYLALLAPSFVISPGLLQKVFGARDQRAVRWGVASNAVCLLLFAIIPAVLGMMAHLAFPNLANRELALPTLLTQGLPLWLGGLLLGAIFAAEVSTADAVLFMLSTSLSKDLYKTFLKPEATDRQLMTVVRWTAVICGLLGAGLGILLESVIDALTIFYTLLSAALALPLLAGLYTKNTTARSALGAMIVSVTITFGMHQLTGGLGAFKVPPLLWGTLAGVFTIFFLQRFAKQGIEI